MKNLNVVQKITKVLSVIIKIIFILAIIGAASTLFCALIFMAFPQITDEIVQTFTNGLEVMNADQLAYFMLATTIILVGQIIALGFVNKYLKKELNTGTPFNHNDAEFLLKVAIINLAVPLGSMLIASIIINMAGISNEVNFQVDILTGLLMILLSYLFHYGAELLENQKEVEE